MRHRERVFNRYQFSIDDGKARWLKAYASHWTRFNSRYWHKRKKGEYGPFATNYDKFKYLNLKNGDRRREWGDRFYEDYHSKFRSYNRYSYDPFLKRRC
jgi:hypothetical protein